MQLFDVHSTRKLNNKLNYLIHLYLQEFVDLYADYLLNTSIDKKFRAFRRGFQVRKQILHTKT